MARRKILWATGFPALLWCLTSSLAFADIQLFNTGGWIVNGATDTGANRQDMMVSVEGQLRGNFSELKVFHSVGGSTPQIFSVKGNGALRPVLPPPGEFGATFYTSGYWDCEQGLIQNTLIIELDIRLNPNNSSHLMFKGKISNLSSFEAMDFALNLFPPTPQLVKVEAGYTLFATRKLCIDQAKQNQHEGFRIARMASNFLSSGTHDSDRASYVNAVAALVRASLQNKDGFILPSPLPMGKVKLFLTHTDALPRNTPTLSIRFSEPLLNEITPQGYVAGSSDPNADNVDLWGNWDGAKAWFDAGEMIGRFDYTLEAIPPGTHPVDYDGLVKVFLPVVSKQNSP